MSRKPHPFTAIGLTRTLRKFSIRDKREIIRKFLFGKNAHRYPVGKGGEEFNEFELDQILVFISAAHVDDYVPSTFAKRDKIEGLRGSRIPSGPSGIRLDDDRSGNDQGRRGMLEDQLDVDEVLSELNSHLDRGGEDE